MKRNWKRNFILLLVTGIMILYFMAPLVWVMISSISENKELLIRPPHWIPNKPTTNNYATLLGLVPLAERKQIAVETAVRYFPRGLLNTFIVAFSTTILCLLFGSISAYTISRFIAKKNRQLTLLALIGIRMIPITSIIIPIYIFSSQLKMLDTFQGLTLAYTGLLIPYSIWLLESFLSTLPRDIEEAALVDGCSAVQAFIRITLPLSLAGLFATGLFVFISIWTDLFIALILTSTPATQTVSIMLALFATGQCSLDWGVFNAGIVVSLFVPVLCAIILRKYIVAGVTMGAVKR